MAMHTINLKMKTLHTLEIHPVDRPHIVDVFSLHQGVTQVISSSQKKIKNLEKILKLPRDTCLRTKK